MAKTITKPILCVERCFDGERSLEDAFAEAYALFFSHKEAFLIMINIFGIKHLIQGDSKKRLIILKAKANGH